MPHRPVACEIHTALITHERGAEHYAASNERALLAQLADFCRAHWAEERQRHPSLPELPPDDNSASIETYFEHVCEEELHRGTAPIARLEDLAALDDDALAEAHARLQQLAATILKQRGAIAAERARRGIAELALGVASVNVFLESDSLAPALVAFDDAGRTVDLDGLPADPRLQQLLAETAVTASGRAVINIVADRATRAVLADASEQANEAGEKLPDTDAILARIKREMPARTGHRRLRWTVADLKGIVELANAERAALARIAEEDGEDRDDAIAALDRITETAEQLLAARTAPASHEKAAAVSQAQVGYLVPLEVVVDLAESAVARVVVIDEAIEMDPEEGARASGTLAPLAPKQARAAVAIAELANGGEWPAMEFGW